MARWWATRALEPGQRGQTLVLVALSLVVLLLVAGLAIDVGVWYGARRHMQNAADAGALAGAWEICHGDPANAASEAMHYAELNGADDSLTEVQVISDTRTVVVTARTSADLYLSSIVLSDFSIPAVAAARCGKATTGCGMWPVAFDLPTYTSTELSGECNGPASWDGGAYLSSRPVNSGADFNDKSQFILWAGDNKDPTRDELDKIAQHCRFYSHPTNGEPYKLADIQGGSPMDPGNRGWVALKLLPGFEIPSDIDYCKKQDTQNCGANALKCWLKYGYIGSIGIGTCLATEEGHVSSALDAAKAKVGEPVSVVLYDSQGCSTNGNPITCGGNKTYHVAGVGCVRVEHVFDGKNCNNVDCNATLDNSNSIQFQRRLGGTDPEDVEYTFSVTRTDKEPYPTLYPGQKGRDTSGTYNCYPQGNGWKCDGNQAPLTACPSSNAGLTGIVVTKLCSCPATDCDGTDGSNPPSAMDAVSLIPWPPE